jgi:hypothetical protein
MHDRRDPFHMVETNCGVVHVAGVKAVVSSKTGAIRFL